MYARILYVGTKTRQEESPSARLVEALRHLGHAVQVCANPEELSYGHSALTSALEAFQPTLVLWDTNSFDFLRWQDVLAAAGCLCVAVDFGADSPNEKLMGLDGVLRFGRECASPKQAPSTIPSYFLATAADRRYQEAVLSDDTVRRNGIVVCQPCDDELLSLIRQRASRAGVNRVERLSDLMARTGARLAHELRTFEFALYVGAPSLAEVSLREAEGLRVLAPRQHAMGEMAPYDAETLDTAIKGLNSDDGHAGNATKAAALDDELPRLLETLDTAAKGLGKRSVLALEDPCRLVMAYGWLGAHNYGDDLLFSLLKQRVTSRYPNAQLYVIGADAHVIQTEYGCEGAAPHEKAAIEQVLPHARALVFLGGLLFDQPMASTAGATEFSLDPWIEPSGQAAIALLAATYNVRSVMLGIGGGPIDLSATKRSVKLLGLAGTLFITRDEHTTELLLGCGVNRSQILTCADLVLGSKTYLDSIAPLEQPLLAKDEAPYFCVSLREWPSNPTGFEQKLALAIDSAIEKTGMTALFLPFDASDVRIHSRVFDFMRHQDRAEVLTERPGERELIDTIRRSTCALAMRLHCSVLHHVLGKPAVGLAYNDKIEAYYKLVGQAHMLHALSDGKSLLEASLLEAHQAGPTELSAIAQAVDGLSKVVDDEYEELFALIDRSSCEQREERVVFYPRTMDRHEIRAIEEEARSRVLEERLKSCEAELAYATHEVREVRDSTSYRIGNAVVRPMVKLRRLFARQPRKP